jgi:hypothetical protein
LQVVIYVNTKGSSYSVVGRDTRTRPTDLSAEEEQEISVCEAFRQAQGSAGLKSDVTGVKQPRREADHSRLSGAEVKNEWSYLSVAPYALLTCTGTAFI